MYITKMSNLEINMEISRLDKVINQMAKFEGDRHHQNTLESHCEYASELRDELNLRLKSRTSDS